MANLLRLDQLQQNFTRVTVRGVELYFSYETCVAAFVPGSGYVQDPTWYSRTTTRHLRAQLGDCRNAESRECFERLVSDALETQTVEVAHA